MKDVDIMIFGGSRCGKTTLANMVAERFHYPVIHTDAFFGAFHQAYSIDVYRKGFGYDDRYPLFLHRYLRDNKAHDNDSVRYILEGCAVSVQNCYRLFHPEKNIVYYLGMTDITPEEALDEIRKRDDSADWTSRKTDDDLLEYVTRGIAQNKVRKELCQQYNIPFIETSHNRDAVLMSILEEIERKIVQLDGDE